MYRFRSSDITNDKYIDAVEQNRQVIIDHYKTLDIREIREIIYHSELTENMYKNLMFALTVADEFTLPATKAEADVLFFVLQVNWLYVQRESKIQIRTISQAHLYIEQSNGHFREILRENAPETMMTSFKCFCQHIPYIEFMWSIPISRIMDGETHRPKLCLAGQVTAPYAVLSFPDIGIHNLNIPRMYYAQLFKDAFGEGNIFADESSIRGFTEVCMSQELFTQILTYCDFKHYYNIKRANCFETNYEFDGLVYAETGVLRNGIEDSQYLLLEDRDYNFTFENLQLEDKEKIIEENKDTIEELKTFWKKKAPNEYNFLTESVQYLPLFDGNDWIEIWLAK